MSDSVPAERGSLLGASLLAGFATGAIDLVWSWSHLAQFHSAFGPKLQSLLFVGCLYALCAALVIPVAAFLLRAFARSSRICRLAADARSSLATHLGPEGPAALAIAFPLVLSASATLAFFAASRALVGRKHFLLVMASALAIGVLTLAVSILVAPLFARLAAGGLRTLPQGVRSLLVHSRAPGVIVLALCAAAVAVLLALSWKTAQHLPQVGQLAAVVLCLGLFVVARRTPSRKPRPNWQSLALLLFFALALFASGSSQSVQKSVSAHTTMGGLVVRSLHQLADFDRDGYSQILGGGDCDDGNARVHPGASEIPDDGIDQNCVAGDPSAAKAEEHQAYGPTAQASVRNVVLITIDTLRADHLGAYGHGRPTSPNLDALAGEGTLFRNAWAHAPSTRYSIPAILTGRYPLAVSYDTSVRGWPGLALDNTTISEIAKKRGLHTGAVLNYWYFDEDRRMNQGFDHYDNKNKRLHRGVSGKGPAVTRGSSSKEQSDKAIEYIDQNADKPFFLWVHYYDPHYEYEKHDEAEDFGDTPQGLYDNEIAYTDHHIGRVIEHLKRRGLYSDTALVVTGDHGEGFGEHGIDLHGYHLYAAQTKVPLIVRAPSMSPRALDTAVGHIDILPTIAELLGEAPSSEMMGLSLLGLMRGAPEMPKRRIYQQLSYENNNEYRGVISMRCHVLFNVSPSTSWEAYRIDEDPDETRDLVDSECLEERSDLEAWYDWSEIPVGAVEALVASPSPSLEALTSFGSKIELLSVKAPSTVKRGQPIAFEYTFRTSEPISDEWRVFAHAESSNGRFSADHSPLRPFSWWKRGDVVRYEHRVTVPRSQAPGFYKLWTGLYRGGSRLAPENTTAAVSDKRVHATSFEVTR